MVKLGFLRMKTNATDPAISIRQFERSHFKAYAATFLGSHNFFHALNLKDGSDEHAFCAELLNPLDQKIFKTEAQNEKRAELQIALPKSLTNFDKFMTELYNGAHDETIELMESEDGLKIVTGAELRQTLRTTCETDIFQQRQLEFQQNQNAGHLHSKTAPTDSTFIDHDEFEVQGSPKGASGNDLTEPAPLGKDDIIKEFREQHCKHTFPQYVSLVQTPTDLEGWKTLFKTHHLSELLKVKYIGIHFGAFSLFLFLTFINTFLMQASKHNSTPAHMIKKRNEFIHPTTKKWNFSLFYDPSSDTLPKRDGKRGTIYTPVVDQQLLRQCVGAFTEKTPIQTIIIFA